MEIAKDTLVKLTYTLRFDKADGEVIEEIGEKDAMEVVVGHDVLLESFEAKIMGLKAGDTFAFSLNPQEAYGEYDEEKLVRVPKAELLEGLPEDAAENIYEGNIIPIVDADETT
ncbi:MAG: FKBP-type peptidyl-prolyl cis-trans isomerase, partial [Bacteroidales bacterium]|nr:FKBP-type peptidyl-prolyl cis-trans isomerase [Bacteroidales bacterium]